MTDQNPPTAYQNILTRREGKVGLVQLNRPREMNALNSVMMAELIDKVEAGHDHDEDPLQFHMKHTDRSFNVGFYSRLREINPDSSFSVIG